MGCCLGDKAPEELLFWLSGRRTRWRARWAEVPSEWATWADAQLGEPPSPLPEVGAENVQAMRYDRLSAHRAAWGQVFTPPALARALTACWAGAPGRILDPACGGGSLLLAIADRAPGTTAEIVGRLEGWDRDPLAAWLCRGELIDWALQRCTGPVPGPLAIRVQDAVHARVERPFSSVVGNPPYLEAKRMESADPGLRARLRQRVPALRGAFDLYLAFLTLGFEWVEPGGQLLWLVPNKVLEGRYAEGFRKKHGASVHTVIDLASLKPRPFPGTGVYPVILDLRSEESREPVRTVRIERLEQLENPTVQIVERPAFRGPWFAPASTWGVLNPLLGLPPLGTVATFVSTVSFHRRGLREQYVHNTREEGDYPYLGASSFTRKTEVGVFRVDWAGGWIRYDRAALSAAGNPLPDLEDTFLRPKVILCQHAIRVRAVADREGRWVTKDVYPVGWPVDPRWSVEVLAAVLNSTVFTALYNTLYRGIVVGGDTYHYLPAFLRQIPVPDDVRGIQEHAERVVRLQSHFDPLEWDLLDRAVAEAYGINEKERRELIEVHLALSSEKPGK